MLYSNGSKQTFLFFTLIQLKTWTLFCYVPYIYAVFKWIKVNVFVFYFDTTKDMENLVRRINFYFETLVDRQSYAFNR